MRKALLTLTLALGFVLATALPANAAGVANGEAPYRTETNAFGLIQCANWQVVLGEAYAADYLYVNATAYRTKGLYCQGGNYPGNANVVARVNYRLMAWSPYAQAWFTCWNWDAVVKNAANSHYAQDFDAAIGCGNTYYYVEAFVEVAMDPGDGIMYWYGHFTATPPGNYIVLNG